MQKFYIHDLPSMLVVLPDIRQIGTSLQIQGRETIRHSHLTEAFVLLTRVQTLETAVRPDPWKMVDHSAGETVRQQSVVILLQAIG